MDATGWEWSYVSLLVLAKARRQSRRCTSGRACKWGRERDLPAKTEMECNSVSLQVEYVRNGWE